MRHMLAMPGSQDNRHTSENSRERQYLCPHQGTVGDPQRQDIEERTLTQETQNRSPQTPPNRDAASLKLSTFRIEREGNSESHRKAISVYP